MYSSIVFGVLCEQRAFDIQQRLPTLPARAPTHPTEMIGLLLPGIPISRPDVQSSTIASLPNL